MSRNLSIRTQTLARLGVFFNRKAVQKILLTLIVLAAIPLWLGLEHAHSAPTGAASPPASPTPSVTIAAPAQVLIGTQVKFKVTFTNGTALGYAPFLDVVLDAGGANITKPPQTPPCTCDGITFVSAQMVGVNGGPIPLTPASALTAPCGSAPNPIPHPFASSGVLPVTVPAGGQLITLALPFGSFQPNQPPIEVEITANISTNADAGHPLTISARGGFRFGTLTPLDDPFPSDPPVFSDENPPGIQVQNSNSWNAQAQITPAVMIITKTYLGPEGENATGPNFIGYYPLRYKLTVGIAPGQTITNVVLTDCIPDNMAFHQLVSVTPAGTSTLPPIDIPSPSGCLTVNWSSLTGSAAVVFEFFIPEKDAQGNPVLPADCKPAISKDSLKIEADWTPVDPCDGSLQHFSQGPVVDTLLDKCIAIQKSVSMFTDTGAPGYTPGDTVEYTLNFQISDYKTFSALDITDSLGDGQKLVGPAPTLVVKDQFGTVSGNFVLNSDLLSAPYKGNDCGRAIGGTSLTFLVSQKMINLAPPNPRHAAGILTGGFATTPSSSTPATGQIVFHAEILDSFAVTQQPGDQFVDKEDPISNCVVIGGKLMTNVDPPALPTSTGIDGHDDSSTTISIVGDTLKKTVYAVKRANTFGVFNPVCGPVGTTGITNCSNSPNPPQEVRAGDQVTFRLEKTIPSSDAENLTIVDWLPLPTFTVSSAGTFANSACGIPAPGNSCLGPGDQMHALPLAPTVWAITAMNGIKFDYGTFNDPANTPRKIDLLFTHTVTNLPFADELFLTNEAQECETNTFGDSFCQVAIAQVNVRQPNLKIHKGTIATDNGFGEFTHQGQQTTNLSLAQAPTGAVFSLAGVSGSVNHAAVAAGLMDSNVSNVDANDIVTFAITIENLGGSPAYDVKIEDIIPSSSGNPSCFTIVPSSIVVKRGTGAIVPSIFYSIQPTNPGSTATSFSITSTPNLPIPISAFNAANAASGANIVTITFQAQLLANVMPGCCDNTVNLLHYSSTLNGPDFVAANLTPPFTDTATICVEPKLTKSLITTSEAHTLLSDVTIGEIVGYRLVVQLPETGLLTNFQVIDALPAGLKFMGTARIAFVSNGPGIFHPSFGPPFGPPFNVVGNQVTLPGLTLNASQTIPSTAITVGSSCGDDPVFNLGNIKNNNSDSDLEYIVIEFNALVCNEAGNQSGTTLSNTFSVSVGGNQIATSNPINVIIVEPNLTMTKTAAPNPAIKGQTLTYTVQYTNNGTADAFDVELRDTLPPGLTMGTVAAGCPFTSLGNVITMTCAQVPKAPGAGSTVIVTYQAVANPATCPATLNNQANLTWTSLPGPQGTLANPTGSSTPGNSGAVDGERDGVTALLTLNDYATTASAAVKIDCPCEATITGLKFNDLNGNGVRDTGEPGLANWTIQVTDSTGITHTTTTDSAGNYSLTVPAPGTYTVAEVLQSGWTQTAPTSGTYSVTVSPGQVINNRDFGNRLEKPKCDLQIKKEMKPNPLVSGQQATATITVKNVGAGPCHGPTKVAESMPAGLTLVSATVPGGSCVLSTGVCNYAPAIPAGGSVVFTYVFNVTAQPGTVIKNCETLKNASDSNPANNKACIEEKVERGESGSLAVTKTVKNLWAMPFPVGTNFPITVSCLPSGPSVTLNLAAGGTQTVNNIPVGSTCTVTEAALPAPIPHPACPSLEWGTPAYAPGQTVTIPSTGGSQTVTVTNTYFCNTTPGCATPPAGMVAWWPLDETSGNVVHSIVGNHDGITQSGPIGSGGPSVAAAPKVGSALFFGVNKAEVPDDPALNYGTGDFSIDAWVRSYQSTLLSAIVDKLDTSTTTHRGYAFFVQNGMVQLRIGDGLNTGTYQSSNTFVADGTWRHVAVTMRRAGGTPVGQFYIDGVPAGGSFAPLAINLDNSAKLLIGSFRLGNNACSCEVSLDEIEMFNTAVKPADIKSIFEADKKGKCKATITGSKYNDLNGNGVRNTGEPGLANWTIRVTDSSGSTQTTTTDSAGDYSLTVAPGTYAVAEILQSGWTQTAPTTGTYAVTVSGSQVVNNRDFGNKKQCAAIALSPAVLPAAGINTPYSQAFTATGGCASSFTYSVTIGALPIGLTLGANGVLSGTATQPGDFTFTVTATDSCGCSQSQTYTLTVNCRTARLRLFNTGVADNGSLLASGATDPHYVLLNTSPVSPNAFVLSANQIVGYVANSATSQWLGPDPPGSNGGQGGFYTYRTTFNLDCDPSTAVISGQWSTDNEAEIFLNALPTGVTTGASAFGAFPPFVITSGFVSGVNTLDFRVRNRLSSQGARTPTGLHVQMNGTVKCCPKTGSLTVTKTVENLSPSPIPAGTSFPVTVSCLPSGPNVTVNFVAGGTQTLNNIPVGSKCTVTEGPLPAPICSPVCGSLQWSAPSYSPGQSVTIPNSGAPQTVTIQNRSVCLHNHPVDAYAFKRGMNEFCIWGGGGSGSYNSPNLIGNPDSPRGFNSPTLVGTGGVRYGAIGLCYGRILTANGKAAFKYTFNAVPVAGLSYPDVNPVFIDRPGQFPVSATRRNVFGGGFSPIGLQLYFRPQERIKPFVSTSGGFIFFNEQVPRLNGARFNFTYDVGGGVQVFRDSRRAFTFGYKYQRLSNGGRAPNNPNFNGSVFYVGYSIFK
ncbi:MAG: hypothetical protein QOH71_3596 [Blastocatellia bacterium]|nr:hypothetical protein [Blastocatellia bacterium]